jgi:hypothetical protein
MDYPLVDDPEGNAQAAYAAVQIAKWIINATSYESAWKFDTSAGGGGAGGGDVAFVGATGGAVWLQRAGQPEVRLDYLAAGGGVGIGWKVKGLPAIGYSGSLSKFPSTGRLRIYRGQRDFDSPADFGTPGVGLVGPCMIAQIDGALIHGGISGAVMLLGISAELEPLLRKFERRIGAISRRLTRPPATGGFWTRLADNYARGMEMEGASDEMAAEAMNMVLQLGLHPWARGALYFAGVQFVGSLTHGISLAASLGLYFGTVRISTTSPSQQTQTQLAAPR